MRNRGDPWSLQMMLGRSTMEMVKTYLAIAQADLQRNHHRASPVDNWRLYPPRGCLSFVLRRPPLSFFPFSWYYS
jgi:hypothetical protein